MCKKVIAISSTKILFMDSVSPGRPFESARHRSWVRSPVLSISPFLKPLSTVSLFNAVH